MRIIVSLVTLIFTMSCGNVSFGKHISLAKEFRKVVQVRVEHKESTGALLGSAVAIDKEHLITAGHFCETAMEGIVANTLVPNVKINYMNENDELASLENAQIVEYQFDAHLDICILKKKRHGIKPVKISQNLEKMKFGDVVYSVGFPLGVFPAIINQGFLSTIETETLPLPVLNGKILSSPAIAGGNSGGALFNDLGEMIGLVVMVHPQYHHIDLAIKSSDILDYLKNLE